MLIIAIIGYALLTIYEAVPLFKQKQWKDFVVNIVLTAVSLAFAILLCLDIRIPSPSKPIEDVVTSIFGK